MRSCTAPLATFEVAIGGADHAQVVEPVIANAAAETAGGGMPLKACL